MQCCENARAEALFRLAEQTDDPQAFLAEMLDIASRMLRGERFDDEDFTRWKKEHGYE